MAVKSEKYQDWQRSLELSINVDGWLYDESAFQVVPRFLAYGVVFLGLEGAG